MKLDRRGYPVPESIPELLMLFFADRENRSFFFRVGINRVVASQIFQEHDKQTEGYKIIIESYAVLHSWKKHSDEEKEKKRGNISILYEDFLSIETIVNDPDRIDSGLTRQRKEALIFCLRKDQCEIRAVFEIRSTRKRTIALTTIYKKKIADSG